MSVKRKYNKADIHISGQYVPAKKGKFIVDAEYVRDDRTNKSLLESLEQIDETVEETAETAAEASQEINERIDNMFDDGKIKSDLLPSYVDDIIEGYYYNGAFYLDSEHTQEIQGESGKIYSDIGVTPAIDYRWGGSAYVVHHAQADWNQSDATAPDYIKNKPTIPDAQIQSDWNQIDNSALDYIKNNPLPIVEFKKQSSGSYYDLLTNITLSDYKNKSLYIIVYNNNNTIYFCGVGNVADYSVIDITGVITNDLRVIEHFNIYSSSNAYFITKTQFKDIRVPDLEHISYVSYLQKIPYNNTNYCNIAINSALNKYQQTISLLFISDCSVYSNYNDVKDLEVYISCFDNTNLNKSYKLLLNNNPIILKDINKSLIFFHIGNPLNNSADIISISKIETPNSFGYFKDVFNKVHELSALTDLDDLITNTALIKDHTYYITGGTDVYLATSNATCIKYSGSVYPVI